MIIVSLLFICTNTLALPNKLSLRSLVFNGAEQRDVARLADDYCAIKPQEASHKGKSMGDECGQTTWSDVQAISHNQMFSHGCSLVFVGVQCSLSVTTVPRIGSVKESPSGKGKPRNGKGDCAIGRAPVCVVMAYV